MNKNPVPEPTIDLIETMQAIQACAQFNNIDSVTLSKLYQLFIDLMLADIPEKPIKCGNMLVSGSRYAVELKHKSLLVY